MTPTLAISTPAIWKTAVSSSTLSTTLREIRPTAVHASDSGKFGGQESAARYGIVLRVRTDWRLRPRTWATHQWGFDGRGHFVATGLRASTQRRNLDNGKHRLRPHVNH
jgi:hypothetical protein